MKKRFPIFGTLSKGEFFEIVFQTHSRWTQLCTKKSLPLPPRSIVKTDVTSPLCSEFEDAVDHDTTSIASPVLKPYPLLTLANTYLRKYSTASSSEYTFKFDQLWNSITYYNSGETVDVLLAKM